MCKYWVNCHQFCARNKVIDDVSFTGADHEPRTINNRSQTFWSPEFLQIPQCRNVCPLGFLIVLWSQPLIARIWSLCVRHEFPLTQVLLDARVWGQNSWLRDQWLGDHDGDGDHNFHRAIWCTKSSISVTRVLFDFETPSFKTQACCRRKCYRNNPQTLFPTKLFH